MGYEVYVLLLFSDVRKAFDLAPHKALMEKMQMTDLDEYLLHWLQLSDQQGLIKEKYKKN